MNRLILISPGRAGFQPILSGKCLYWVKLVARTKLKGDRSNIRKVVAREEK